jgi:hypothetical protein
MTTIRKPQHTASSSPQRSATKSEASKPADKLGSSSTDKSGSKSADKLGSKPESRLAQSVGHPDLSRFTPARSRPLMALQTPGSAGVNQVALSARAQGAAEPERLRTTHPLNLRRTASTELEALAILAPGTELEVTPNDKGVTRKDGFVHVTWNDNGVKQTGWVAEEFTTPVAPSGPVSPGTTPGSSAGLTIPQANLQLGATGPGVRQL